METFTTDFGEFALGCLPRTAPLGSKPLLESAVTILPKDQWRVVDLHHFIEAILNQGQHGACVGFGCDEAYDTLRRGLGLPDAPTSPWDLYRQINGGQDAGANIHDALTALEQTGVCELSLCPSYTQSRPSAEVIASRAKHKIVGSFDCPTRDMMATALQKGFPMPFGVSVTTTWAPDADGWIFPRGSSRGGHCIMGLGFAKHPTRQNYWGIPFVNSWTASWGIGGWGIYPLELINEGYADSWAATLTTISNK